MRKLSVVLAVLAATVFPASALATNDNEVLGPAGYSGPPAPTSIVAGTPNVLLTSGDHVVICHAIGGPSGTEFVQIAPSAGVAAGHVGHEGARDIIPPFRIRLGESQNTDDSAAAGQNWTAANIAVYNNGCNPVPPVVPPAQCPTGTTPVPNSNPLVCIKEVRVEVPVEVIKEVFTERVVEKLVPGPERVVTVTVPGPERIVTVEKPVEKIVYKDRVVTKTKTVVKWKTRTVTKTKVKVVNRCLPPAPERPREAPYTP